MNSYHVDVSYVSDWIWSQTPAVGQVGSLENSIYSLNMTLNNETCNTEEG